MGGPCGEMTCLVMCAAMHLKWKVPLTLFSSYPGLEAVGGEKGWGVWVRCPVETG